MEVEGSLSEILGGLGAAWWSLGRILGDLEGVSGGGARAASPRLTLLRGCCEDAARMLRGSDVRARQGLGPTGRGSTILKKDHNIKGTEAYAGPANF